MINENTTAKHMLDRAVKKVKGIPSGETFVVRDLFCAVDWKRVPVKTRTKLNAMFLDYAQSEHTAVKTLEKNSQNQQVYEKK